jgi:galactokinase
MTSATQVADLFTEEFGTSPDGVWSAPGRVNLIGEHTDYTGGLVLPFAINQRAWIAARPRTDGIVRAVAHGRGAASALLHEVSRGRPADWLGYLAGAAWVMEGASGGGWDLALASDVPIGGGLSSSASITCAALLAMDDLSSSGHGRQELAGLAQRVEHEVIGIPCGIMDQTASLLCTRNHLLALDTRTLDVVQVPWRADGLALLVTDTRAPHVLADGQYADRRRQCEEATVTLGVSQLRDATLAMIEEAGPLLTADQAACARHVVSENGRVIDTRTLLEQGRTDEIGPLLTASHASLRDDFRVTVPQLDVAAEAALDAGALGARMTGGGFGGSTLTLVRGEDLDAVRTAIDTAFADHGFGPPAHFVTAPADGAQRNA